MLDIEYPNIKQAIMLMIIEIMHANKAEIPTANILDASTLITEYIVKLSLDQYKQCGQQDVLVAGIGPC
jgi:hypothetical protein